MFEMNDLAKECQQILDEMVAKQAPRKGDVFVIGCSTSEILGKHIGKAGSPEVAATIYPVLKAFADEKGLILAFQCCEHLNRALVIERTAQMQLGLKEVSAVPHYKAGGAMSSHAYRAMGDAVLVESIQAGYGLDIGETMIGMHMRPVVVPMRIAQRTLGGARVNPSFSRAPLIGGLRARYTLSDADGFSQEG